MIPLRFAPINDRRATSGHVARSRGRGGPRRAFERSSGGEAARA
jgi:hypothetical protein